MKTGGLHVPIEEGSALLVGPREIAHAQRENRTLAILLQSVNRLLRGLVQLLSARGVVACGRPSQHPVWFSAPRSTTGTWQSAHAQIGPSHHATGTLTTYPPLESSVSNWCERPLTVPR